MQQPFTNSEGVKRCLTIPEGIPSSQLHYRSQPPFAAGGNLVVKRRPKSAPARRIGDNSTVSPWRGPSYLPQRDHTSFHVRKKSKGLDITKKTPWAARKAESYINSTLGYPKVENGHSIPYSAYDSLNDPHLQEYFERKFGLLDYSIVTPHPPSEWERKEDKAVLYKIAVTTGDKQSAGTSAKVFITVKGNRSKISKTRLTKRAGSANSKKVAFRFAKGTTHVFKIRGPEIGDVKNVVIETNALKKEEAWFLQEIQITNVRTKKSWLFLCNQWMSLHHGDGLTSRRLYPEISSKTEYEVVVVTGDKETAGTEANVYMTLYGKTGSTPKLPLKNNRDDNFGAGSSSIFNVVTTCCGPLTKLRIEHDNRGKSPGWYLERIVITDLRHPHWKYFFSCSQWLARDKGDGEIYRILKGNKDPYALRKANRYRVTTFTGNKRGAGTDANVYLLMYGDLGDSGERSLGNTKSTLCRGSKDEFMISCPTLGKLERIRIGHDNSGFGPGWFLEKVIVDDIDNSRVFEFPCGRWFATDEDDHQISRELKLNFGPIDGEIGQYEGNKGYPHTITVRTGNKSNAGTNARVYIVMYGSKSGHDNSGKVWLENGNFSKGKSDIFNVKLNRRMSPFSKIDIGHDNSGTAAGWFLDRVTILCRTTGIEQSFMCDEWLAIDEGDCKTQRTLYEHTRKTVEGEITWNLWVHTSEKNVAGTDAKIFVCLYGDKGKSDEIQLIGTKDSFEAGKIDNFTITTKDIGKPYKMRIYHDASGIFPGWHLDKVEMENFLTKAHYAFHCGRWLAKDEDDRSIVREMPAEGHKIKPLPLVKYIVEVYTGNRSKAGTNADVYINIFGQLGDTGVRPLNYSKSHIDKFEKGKDKMDEFMLEAVTLKKLQKIRIGHNGKGPGAGWFLEKVVVRQMGDRAFDTTFECNRWLASDEDDQQLEREITASGSQMLSTTTYHISVKTGNVRNAGTDANVYVKIFGTNGDTGMIELRASQTTSNKFERGRIDVFKRDATDIGKIKRIRIGHDGSKMGSGWFLDEVVIDIPSRGEKYTFAVHRWLDKSEGDGEIELELEPTLSEGREKSIPYEVTVWTGDVSGAGTNSKVFLQMYGDGGKTDEISLANKTDNFERNAVDKFKVEAADVGELRKIRIGHDGTGSFSGWYLDKLLIQRRPKKGTRKQRKRSSERQSARQSLLQQYLDDDDSDTSSLSSTPRQRRRTRSARREPELMTVEEEDEMYDGEETIDYWFFVKRWFAKSEDDHQIVRELIPTDEHGNLLRNSLEEAEYSIKVITGDVSGAGTDANVYVNLYGEKGDTGERHLSKSNHMNKFERNQEDIFTIKAIDLGKLVKCKIRHDNKGGLAAWFLNSVEVHDKRRKKDYFFPCQRWLATNEDDGQIARDLVPVDLSLKNMLNNKDATGVRDMIALESKAATTTFHLYVKTGDKLGAGTDANVYVVLHGEADNTGRMPLKTSLTNKNKFERNKTDEFVLEAVNIGELKKIKIGHDNAGGGGAWFLDEVRIKAPSLGRSWIFPCNRWLAKDEDDGKLERELHPQELATEEYNPCIPYEITTYTSDESGASTSADVYIQLYGKDTVTEKKSLCNKKERKSKFQRGSKDTFVVELEDVGENIEKIRIGHDNSGIGAGWHLDRVEIRKLHSSGKGSITFVFPCGRWLARNEGDKCIERELVAEKVTQEIVGRDGEMKKKNLKIREQLQSKKYTVNVITGDVSGAGTDAKVYITIHGSKGDSGERYLHTSETHRDKFERNQTDVFQLEAVDLGNLYKIKIRHDNSMISPSWYLDRVEVVDNIDRETFTFHCERWLAKNKDDGKIERAIYVKGYDGEMDSSTTLRSTKYGSVTSLDSIPFSKSPRMLRKGFELDDVTEGPSIPYNIRVSTGDGPDNGTKSNVWINIMGTKKTQTGRQFLDLSQKKEFKPGAIDTFQIEAVEIKEIRKIEIGHDGTAPGTGWFLKDVEVEQSTLGKRYHFVCKSWLARDKEPGQTSRILKVDDGQSSVTSFKPMVVYEASIETGDINEAGTDSQLTMTVFGSKGTSAPITLEKGDYRFERARKDEMTLEVDDVAPLKKIRLASDGKGSRPDWFCKEVKLRNMSTGQLTVFHVNQWLSRNKEDGKHIRDIAAIENRRKVIDSTRYKISVKTSDMSGAGTDANVYVKIFGAFGDSGDLHLKASESNNKKAFERNQIDTFEIETLDLGELSKLRVWHDNKGLMGSAWHLSYIEVEDLSRNKKSTFHCDKWLSRSADDKQILRELTCGSIARASDSPGSKDRINYEIEVTTSDKKQAGTGHNVWIVLEGSKKDSKVFTMENSERNKVFKRGKCDTFQFRSPPLGKLKYCTVGAYENEDLPLIDPEGHEAQWHCNQIAVIDPNSGKRYVFECNSWIDIHKKVSKSRGEKLSLTSMEEGAVAVTRGLAPVMYDVMIYTGGESGAGTDANVFITIYGTNGDTGKRELKQKFRNLFEKNQLDKFQLEALDLGLINKITIEHDNSGWKNSAWFLDKVEIVNTTTSRKSVFPCQKWLDKKRGLSRDLFPQQD